MDWVSEHAREDGRIGLGFSCVHVVLVPAVGSRCWEGGGRARARCALLIDVFDVECVSGPASACCVMCFWEAEMSFRICSVLSMSSWMHHSHDVERRQIKLYGEW